MNKTTFAVSTLALLACLAQPAAVQASRALLNTTGTITGAALSDEVTVDGHTYKVTSTPQNEDVLLAAKRGDHVDLVLSGPPTDPRTRVVSISVTKNGKK